jgi:hypothetical protein
MNLPNKKNRKENEFYLVNGFQSKVDAQMELRKIRDENALFGKKKSFVFSSKNPDIVMSFGVYEQVFYAN